MSDRDTQLRSDFQTKVKESEAAVEYDRQCKLKDFQDFVKKFNYLKNFRDDNKMVRKAKDRHMVASEILEIFMLSALS